MASLAEKRIADAEERSVDPEARPEELRLLEALLFASTEPLDQATLAKRPGSSPGFSIFKGELSTRLRLPEIYLHVKFFFEELRAAAGIAQIFRGVSARVHLKANSAALKRSSDFQDSLPMRVIERLGNS